MELVIWELTDRWSDDGDCYYRCIVTPERAKELDALADAAGLFITCTRKPQPSDQAERWMREMSQ